MGFEPFTLSYPPKRTTSVVFASPHSGRDYSRKFLNETVLDEKTIRSSEDAFVDQLFNAAPDFGAPLLAARVPRAYVDMNRAADELDPAVIEGATQRGHNPRISSGLGVIPRVVAGGRAIYRGKISRAEADTRLHAAWEPYHNTLRSLLAESEETFGEAILIDCHSMPTEAIGAITASKAPRPDVVLGDRFGAAASEEIVGQIEAAFEKAGLRVARNTPFAGAYVAQTYGRPSRQRHVVQIEIDRALYMDERNIQPNAHFADFCDVMTSVVAEITEIGRRGNVLPLAAE